MEQQERAIALHDSNGVTPVPCASLALLMLGPGTNVTHAAMRALADTNCLVAWTGEEGVRLYAHGLGATRSAANVERQARLWTDAASRRRVAAELHRMRFPGGDPEGLTLEQLRGTEGIRMREAYAAASRDTGVAWKGRTWDEEGETDPLNRALSWANACLYGLCHAVIVAMGYSPALGFLHQGNARSFVFDIADLYEPELSITVAFETVAAGSQELEPRVRRRCRDLFRERRLLERAARDIERAISAGGMQREPDAAGVAPGTPEEDA